MTSPNLPASDIQEDLPADIAPTTSAAGSTLSRRQDRNRQAVLDAARELLLERGLEGFSLREVARRVDYTPGALYTYFPSLEDLVAALGLEALGVLEGYLTAVTATLPPAERVVALGDAYLDFAAERPDQYQVVFERLVLPAQTWGRFTKVARPFTLIIAAFEDGIAAGAFKPSPGFGAAEMAYGMWCIANGAAGLSRRHLAQVTGDLRAAQLNALRAYVQGVSVEGSGS